MTAPRIPYVPKDMTGPVADAIRDRRGGELLELDRMLLHNPAIAEGWNHLLGAIRRQSRLSAAEREIAICWVAVLNNAKYEWHQHAPLALEAGVDEKVLEALQHRDVSGLNGRLQLVTRVTTAMTRSIELKDELFEEAKEAFGQDSLHDLIAVVATYNLVSRYLVALRVGGESACLSADSTSSAARSPDSTAPSM